MLVTASRIAFDKTLKGIFTADRSDKYIRTAAGKGNQITGSGSRFFK